MQKLDSYFRELEARDAYSGVVLVTRGAEHLFAGAYGYASRAWRAPNTLDTRFDTASVTKLFTALAALQLVERGLLELDTRTVEFLGLPFCPSLHTSRPTSHPAKGAATATVASSLLG